MYNTHRGHITAGEARYADRKEHKNSELKDSEGDCGDVIGVTNYASVMGLTGGVKGRWRVLDMNYQKRPSR